MASESMEVDVLDDPTDVDQPDVLTDISTVWNSLRTSLTESRDKIIDITAATNHAELYQQNLTEHFAAITKPIPEDISPLTKALQDAITAVGKNKNELKAIRENLQAEKDGTDKIRNDLESQKKAVEGELAQRNVKLELEWQTKYLEKEGKLKEQYQNKENMLKEEHRKKVEEAEAQTTLSKAAESRAQQLTEQLALEKNVFHQELLTVKTNTDLAAQLNATLQEKINDLNTQLAATSATCTQYKSIIDTHTTGSATDAQLKLATHDGLEKGKQDAEANCELEKNSLKDKHEADKSNYEQNANKAQEKIDKLDNTIEKLRADLVAKNIAAENAEKALGQLKQEQASVADQHKSIVDRNDSDIRSLRQELDDTKKQLHNTEKELNTARSGHEMALMQAQTDIQNKALQNHESFSKAMVATQGDKFNVLMAQVNEHDTLNDAIVVTVEEGMKDLSALIQTAVEQSAQTNINHMHNDAVNSLNSVIVDARQVLQTLRDESQNIQDTNQTMAEAWTEWKPQNAAQFEKLSEAINIVTAAGDRIQSDIEDYDSAKTIRDVEYPKVHQELEAAQAEIAKLTQEVIDAQENLTNKDQDLITAQQTSQEVTQNLEIAQQTIARKTQEYDDAQQSLMNKDQELINAQQVSKQALQQLDIAQQTIAQKTQEYDHAQQAVEQLSQQLNTMQQDLIQKSRDLQDCINSHNADSDEVQQIRNDNDRLQEQVNEDRADLRQASDQLDAVRQELEKAQNERDAAYESLGSFNRTEQDIHDAICEADSYRDRFGELSLMEVVALVDERFEFEKELKSLGADAASRAAKLARTRQEREEAERRLEEARAARSLDNTNCHHAKTALQNEIDRLKKGAEEQEKKCEEEKDDLKKKLEALKDKLPSSSSGRGPPPGSSGRPGASGSAGDTGSGFAQYAQSGQSSLARPSGQPSTGHVGASRIGRSAPNTRPTVTLATFESPSLRPPWNSSGSAPNLRSTGSQRSLRRPQSSVTDVTAATPLHANYRSTREASVISEATGVSSDSVSRSSSSPPAVMSPTTVPVPVDEEALDLSTISNVLSTVATPSTPQAAQTSHSASHAATGPAQATVQSQSSSGQPGHQGSSSSAPSAVQSPTDPDRTPTQATPRGTKRPTSASSQLTPKPAKRTLTTADTDKPLPSSPSSPTSQIPGPRSPSGSMRSAKAGRTSFISGTKRMAKEAVGRVATAMSGSEPRSSRRKAIPQSPSLASLKQRGAMSHSNLPMAGSHPYSSQAAASSLSSLNPQASVPRSFLSRARDHPPSSQGIASTSPLMGPQAASSRSFLPATGSQPYSSPAAASSLLMLNPQSSVSEPSIPMTASQDSSSQAGSPVMQSAQVVSRSLSPTFSRLGSPALQPAQVVSRSSPPTGVSQVGSAIVPSVGLQAVQTSPSIGGPPTSSPQAVSPLLPSVERQGSSLQPSPVAGGSQSVSRSTGLQPSSAEPALYQPYRPYTHPSVSWASIPPGASQDDAILEAFDAQRRMDADALAINGSTNNWNLQTLEGGRYALNSNQTNIYNMIEKPQGWTIDEEKLLRGQLRSGLKGFKKLEIEGKVQTGISSGKFEFPGRCFLLFHKNVAVRRDSNRRIMISECPYASQKEHQERGCWFLTFSTDCDPIVISDDGHVNLEATQANLRNPDWKSKMDVNGHRYYLFRRLTDQDLVRARQNLQPQDEQTGGAEQSSDPGPAAIGLALSTPEDVTVSVVATQPTIAGQQQTLPAIQEATEEDNSMVVDPVSQVPSGGGADDIVEDDDMHDSPHP